MKSNFNKPFTQQEAIDEATIERVSALLRGGRLHRYNTLEGEISEAAQLEKEYATYQEARYCLACSSGGYALAVALRAAGLKPGDTVLANAYTLAPVPGAIHNAGGIPLFVEIDDAWHIDVVDLQQKAEVSGARFLMLSHMRGHIADMDRIVAICKAHQITIVEDCAHTMGARWNGIRSGNFGHVAAFSAQTYKHINSGEGGLLTTDDPVIAARAIIMSGSYMLYGSHGAAPDEAVFAQVKLETPNYSGRMDNMRAAILRGQLQSLDDNVRRWNERYRVLETRLSNSTAIDVTERRQNEEFVGSSIQFRPRLAVSGFEPLIANCLARGVDIKWFGAEQPKAFTSRYDSWRYLGEQEPLPQTLEVLSRTCDIRVPLTFEPADCKQVADIIAQEVEELQSAFAMTGRDESELSLEPDSQN
ncbi:MAG: aminotransferase class I/II-fold pyridoxal phosphate-dependent enzyme [Rhizobiaceae bacterium]|nr:aminotransferase class I/II-fold pyridoxal phosphate-dependent enzyme [Rhizobiaceae bacterium]